MAIRPYSSASNPLMYGGLLPQEEMQAVGNKHKKLSIGIPVRCSNMSNGCLSHLKQWRSLSTMAMKCLLSPGQVKARVIPTMTTANVAGASSTPKARLCRLTSF